MPKRHRDNSLVWTPGMPEYEEIRRWVFSEEYDALFWECVRNTRPRSRASASVAVTRMRERFEYMHRALDRYPSTDKNIYVRIDALYAYLFDRLVSVYTWLQGKTWTMAHTRIANETYQNHDYGAAQVRTASAGNSSTVCGPCKQPYSPEGEE